MAGSQAINVWPRRKLTLLGSDSLAAREFEVRLVTVRPEVNGDWPLQPGTRPL